MGRYFLFLLLLIGTIESVFAQNESETILRHLAKAEALQYELKDSAIYHATIAEDLSQRLGDNSLLAKTYNRQGAVHYVSGNYSKAMERFSMAWEIFDEIGDMKGKVFAMNGLGLIYLTEDEFEQAIDLWEQCLEINRSLGDSVSVAKNLFNIGIGHCELLQHEQSYAAYSDALIFLKGNEGHGLNLMIRNRMAKHFFDIGDPQQSLSNYLDVLENVENVSTWEKAYAYTGLGEVYLSINDLQKAEEYGAKGYEEAQQIGAHWDLERVTSLLSKLYQQNGDISNALFFTQQNKAHSDSLYTSTKNRQISRLQLKVSQAVNESLIAENEAALQKVKFRNIALILSLIGLIILAGLIFVMGKNIKLKERFNKELKELNSSIRFQNDQIAQQNASLSAINRTKDKLFSILSHDLRSPIHSILQTLELHQMGYFDESQKNEAMDLLYKQVSKTDSMLNDLLKWASEQTENIHAKFSSVDAGSVIEELVEVYDFQARAKDIQVRHQLRPISPIWVDRNQFRIIFQNLFHNAVKFTPSYGEISIFYEEDEFSVTVYLRDSGEGMDEQSLLSFSGKKEVRMHSMVGTADEKGSGLGLLLVRQFVAQNKGFIGLSNLPVKGTEFKVTFQKASPVQINS
ncbi:tetratricopeptide repeat-containing sensor histidine kinase [Lunatibacter salilacus]|uniref:tetratricopeptide repeat-containing sensor histidine kinase n=1 Tax=Lunatibacter salilacus TaxID=2483804 RepID=UPI00131CAE64|nr:ATP-binding protein [Lunatibacter salilacus]